MFSYAILREWTGDFVTVPAADGPHGILGRGAFGEVFKGLALAPNGAEGDLAAAVRLAVKRMDVKYMQLGHLEGSRESFMASFHREVRLLSRFRHPNIVRLLGFSEPCLERREPPCLVYELLALGSLSSQLKDDVQAALFPWQTRVDVLLQISTAINYLHCHNPGNPAYHRDIKADNIALSADYTAKLIDCGYGIHHTLLHTYIYTCVVLPVSSRYPLYSLSKYIAEDGKGGSINSATGGRYLLQHHNHCSVCMVTV